MADEGGRGGLDPPFLADIICEQPLINESVTEVFVEQPLALPGSANNFSLEPGRR